MLNAKDREGLGIQRAVRLLPRVAGIIVVAISTTVLLGWAFGIRSMQSFVPGLVTMKANTALGLGLSALSLLLFDSDRKTRTRRRAAALSLAALVIALGAGTIAEYVFGVNLGLDQILVLASVDAALTRTPGRMAFVTAFAFVMIGGALVCTNYTTKRGKRPAQWLALAAGAVAMTALLGYVYGVIPKKGVGEGIQIAMHTSIAFALLAAGALAQRAEVGWMPTLLSRRAGGVLARHLLPVAFIVPLLFGLMWNAWDKLFPGNTTNGGAVIAVATMFAFTVVIWRTAEAMNETDRQSSALERAHLETQLREGAERQRADFQTAALAEAERAREMAERASREKDDAMKLLDLVLDSAPIGFAVFDTELRYLRINSTLAAINGAPAAAHIGRTLREMVPHDTASVEELAQRVLTTGLPVSNTEQGSTMSDAAGVRRHWLTNFYPIRSSTNELLGVGATVQETTELKCLEDQVHQGHRLKAVGQLAGGVAHDFNNILTVITSYSGMLLADEKLDGELRLDVCEIKAAADRAAALTRQLLAFSRQQVLQPQPLDLNAVTENLEKLLRRLIREDVELVTSLCPELGIVNADPGQIEQVLVNLVVNARDAMPEGGRILIETANVHLDAEYSPLHANAAPGRYVMLAVSDNGIGMDAATRARIFEPFFTTKGVGEGTGLGLATVYGIVKQSGGNIWVYSEPRHGTTFKVYLPLATETSCDVPRVIEPGGDLKGTETILLVEDESPVRSVIRRILERSGYTVLEAENGDEALHLCQSRPGEIDLVITDMVMPELGGRELANALLAASPDMRVLFMSGYTEDAALQRSLLQPGGAFLEKPFTVDALTRKVRSMLQSEPVHG